MQTATPTATARDTHAQNEKYILLIGNTQIQAGAEGLTESSTAAGTNHSTTKQSNNNSNRGINNRIERYQYKL